ncbi:MAG: CBS domain-containing protein [Methanomassiliicoccales archaeon]|jgi:CBS domain-containing protein|nr:CBS domain-containing protein [Methanomassiliicoccales archaeon]
MTLVEEIMTPNPIVAQIPSSRNEVLKIMVKHNLTGLPVIRRNDGILAGMITRQDIFEKPDEEQLALIMNRDPPTIGPKDNVKKAAELFITKQVRHLPVVDGAKLIGIVTPTDLLGVVEKIATNIPVEKVIRSPCVPIYQDAPLAVALVTFKVSKASALPVLDDTGRLVGILTDRDIFNKSYINGSVAMADLGIGQDEDEWTWEGLRNVMKLWYEVSKIELPGLPVREIMVREPVTVFKKTSVAEAARIMRKNDFGQLPVRDSKDNLLAMIYDFDVISVLLGDQ